MASLGADVTVEMDPRWALRFLRVAEVVAPLGAVVVGRQVYANLCASVARRLMIVHVGGQRVRVR